MWQVLWAMKRIGRVVCSAESWPVEQREVGLVRNLAALELFPIVLSVELWGQEFRNKRIRFHCDNMGVVQVINSITAFLLLLFPYFMTWFLLVYSLTVVFLLFIVREWIILWLMLCLVSSGLDSVGWHQKQSGEEFHAPSIFGHCISTSSGLLRISICASTWNAYHRVWQEWSDLVSEVGVCSGKDDCLHVLLYFICRNFERGVSISSMSHKLAGLAFMFKLLGWVDATKVFLVKP